MNKVLLTWTVETLFSWGQLGEWSLFIVIRFTLRNHVVNSSIDIFKKIIETSLPEYCCRELLEFCWCSKLKECLEFYSELPQVFLWAVTYLPKKLKVRWNKTLKSQFYIQLVSHFGTWILLFGPFGQLRAVRKKSGFEFKYLNYFCKDCSVCNSKVHKIKSFFLILKEIIVNFK